MLFEFVTAYRSLLRYLESSFTSKKREKSETRMTNSILNQDPNIRKFKKNAIYYDKTQHANFGGKSLF